MMAEVEAVEAVYGDDCHVIEGYPPHLHVHLKPRTADVYSQQYPEEPPDISVIDSKGLDERRQKNLITSIREKSCELAPCLMLVALCEEAVERLSSMNHPDGDCPLCLFPLHDEDSGSKSLPFMKLRSCFHCFHCDCIIRWWNWTQTQTEKENMNSASSTSQRIMRDQQGMCKMVEVSMGKCPVCRKVFLAKDIEHVLDLAGTVAHLDSDSNAIEIDGDILHSDSERIRRQKFEAFPKGTKSFCPVCFYHKQLHHPLPNRTRDRVNHRTMIIKWINREQIQAAPDLAPGSNTILARGSTKHTIPEIK